MGDVKQLPESFTVTANMGNVTLAVRVLNVDLANKFALAVTHLYSNVEVFKGTLMINSYAHQAIEPITMAQRMQLAREMSR